MPPNRPPHSTANVPNPLLGAVPDVGLRAANMAFSGHHRREASRFASIELRMTDPKSGPWEAAAILSVMMAAVSIVMGLWFL